MNNLAVKIEEIEAQERQAPLFAFSRVVYTPPSPPAFIAEDHEVERLAFQMPTVKVLPYSLFVDDQGRVHFEINYSSWSPRRNWKTWMINAIRPDQYFYDLLRSRIIGGSLLKNERRLIGGAICTYSSDRKESEVILLGILPREHTLGVNPEIRRKAMNLLTKRHHSFLRWLGAKGLNTTPCVIPVEKMERHGWAVKDLSLRQRWEKFRDGLPMSLLKRQTIYRDQDYERHCRDYPATERCEDCGKLADSNL